MPFLKPVNRLSSLISCREWGDENGRGRGAKVGGEGRREPVDKGLK